MDKEYKDLEVAVISIRERVNELKGKEEFREFEKLITGVEKRCVATLIEDFFWGKKWK